MIKIAVVDDEYADRKLLLDYFGRLKSEICEETVVQEFRSGDDFLKDFEDSWDLICLDIDMEGRDGISTAARIRRQDTNVIIIFITNMAQMAIRGYEVQALDFVVKPLNYYSFALKMRNAMDIIGKRKSKNIAILTASGVYKIATDDLYYVEVSDHYLCYHTKKGNYQQKASLRELEERLAGLSFKRCNNCYLVNLKYVDCVEKDDLQIAGEWLKISRSRKKEFLQSLANYIGGIE